MQKRSSTTIFILFVSVCTFRKQHPPSSFTLSFSESRACISFRSLNLKPDQVRCSLEVPNVVLVPFGKQFDPKDCSKRRGQGEQTKVSHVDCEASSRRKINFSIVCSLFESRTTFNPELEEMKKRNEKEIPR